MVDMAGWSEMKKLKYSLLRRAFSQNRGPEMILLIQWRSALTKSLAAKDAERLKAFETENENQPRAVRMLNLIEEMNGNKVVHKNTANKPRGLANIFTLLTAPEESHITYSSHILSRIYGRKAKDVIIVEVDRPKGIDLSTTRTISADHYDPMDGLRIRTAYGVACRDSAEAEAAVAPLRLPPNTAPALKH